MSAITLLAVPVKHYSVDILKQTQAKIRKINTQTRKNHHNERCIHKLTSTGYTYLKKRGRGLTSVKSAYKFAKMGLHHYLKLKLQETMKVKSQMERTLKALTQVRWKQNKSKIDLQIFEKEQVIKTTPKAINQLTRNK